ncbi:MAG: nucleotidyltransferase family protein [Actinomycetota bacterium]
MDEVIAILKAHEGYFRAKGITRLAVFGSVARGDAGPESDIDLVIDIDEDGGFSLFDQVEVQQESSELLHRKVDVVSRRALGPRLAAIVSRDGVDVFRS